MIKPSMLGATTMATAFAVAACGGSSSQHAAQSQLSAIQSAAGQSSASSAATATSSSGKDPATVDVCALLSPADAAAVATADKLDQAQTASTVYKLATMKSDTGSGSDEIQGCRFSIDDGGGAEGTIDILAEPGSAIAEYTDGTKVDGLGDEAYTNENGGTVARVGSVLLAPQDDSFSSQITIDLLRKMAPNLT